MVHPSRTKLIEASNIPSSYRKKRSTEYWDIKVFKQNRNIPSDFYEALQKLNKNVIINGGHLHITDLYRSWDMQAQARKDYETGKKRAFVAMPGGSFHNAARAMDISLDLLQFSNLPKDEWLEFFWTLAKPLGFKPIIRIPDMDASEAWHFDFPGKDWEDAYETISYKESSKCCILDAGLWNPQEELETVRRMFIQSQLIRLGHYEIGKVDGVFGKKTNKILEFLNLEDFPTSVMADTLSRR